MSTVATPYGVLMGNLNNAISKSEVCSMIVFVFNYVLGINIAWYNVNISSSRTQKSFTATIFVPNEICQNLAVQTLDESVLPYGLIKEGQRLIVDYFWGHEKQIGGTVLTSRAEINYQKRKRKREEKRTRSNGNTGQVQSIAINSASQEINENQSTSNDQELNKGVKTDASNNANLLELHNNADSIADKLDKIDYLKKNQQLGNETRKLEFKRGDGNYLRNNLKSVLGTYMSAFLNSSGGTLLIGVDDEGLVQGIPLDHKAEDKVRLDIDDVMRRMKPAVFPNIYSVSFIPVQDKMQCNLKVIKITVGTVGTKMLYGRPDGDMFIRRDGSIQALKAEDVQELWNMKHEEELEKKEADFKKQIESLEYQLKHKEELERKQADFKKQIESQLKHEEELVRKAADFKKQIESLEDKLKHKEELERKEANFKKQIESLEYQLEDANLRHNRTKSNHKANGNRKSSVCVVS